MLILMNIEQGLEELGCRNISAASTVKQALSLLGAQTFDAALVDINLGGNESYPVADALAGRGVPFAFSSGYSAKGVKAGYGHRPMLRKPYNRIALADMFERLLDTPLPAI